MRMKAAIISLMLLIIMNIFSVIGASASSNSNERLQYFGYYGMDGPTAGKPTDEYIQLVGKWGNSNVAVIHGWLYGETLRDTIESAASQNMQVILNVFDIFFTGGFENGGHLVESWENNWTTLKQTLTGLEDNVLAFYFDEPWWNGVSEEKFRFVTKLIREDYPDTRVMQVSALYDLDPGNTGDGIRSEYLEYVTDVGFDYYSGWDLGEYLLYHERLKALANKNQDIWLIPRAFSGDNTSDGMQQELLRHYELALKEPRVVGILPFIFSSAEWWEGLKVFLDETDPRYDSYLKNTHIQVGKSVIASSGPNDNLYGASLDFSSVQGTRGWSYQQGDGSTYTDLNWNAGELLWQGANQLTVGPDFQQPDINEAVRKWVAPKSGTIQIATNGNIRKSDASGDGVRFKLLKNNIRIWPEDSEWKQLQANDKTGFPMKSTIEVQAGDVLYFVANPNSDSTGDKIFWNPVIIYKTITEPSTRLDGPVSARPGDAVDLQIGIAGDPLNFTTWRGVVNYDAAKLQFATKTVPRESGGGTYQALAEEAYSNSRAGFELLSSEVNAEQGKIYITMASNGAGNAVRNGGGLLTLFGSVKAGAAKGNTEISLTDLKVSMEEMDTDVAGSSFTMSVFKVDPDELIVNPGFEEGLDGWTYYNTSAFDIVHSPVHSGANSLKISARAINYTGVKQDITAALSANGQGLYDFGAMLRTKSGSQNMYAAIVVYNTSGSVFAYAGSTENVGSDSWTRSSGTANITWTGELASAMIITESLPETGKGDYYVDDVSLKKQKPPAARLGGPASVQRGGAVDLQIGIAGDPLNFTTWRGVVNYDAAKLQFATETVTRENDGGTYQALAEEAYSNSRTGFELLSSEVNAEQGKIYITMAGGAVQSEGDLLTLFGSIKADAAKGNTEVSVTDIRVSMEEMDTDVAGSSFTMDILGDDPEELIVNPGFEDGLDGWTYYNTVTFDIVNSPVHSGANSLKISDRAINYTGVKQDITDALAANGQGLYDFGAMLRTEADSQNMYAAIVVYNTSGSAFAYAGSTDTVGSGSWTRSSGTVNITWTGDLASAMIITESLPETGKGNYYVDDISLKKQKSNQSTLTSSASTVLSGSQFKVNYGLRNVQQAVYAQDVQLDYDASVLEFVSAESLIQGVSIVDTQNEQAGKLRLTIASEDAQHAITGNAQVVELTFRAKSIPQAASGLISIKSAALKDEQGDEVQAALSSVNVEVTASENNMDINANGKVSIGDLSIVAAHYGKGSGSPDWNEAKKADVNGDGKIDFLDLAAVARTIVS
ncbi:cohesin domain-containing protein [Paenibacillus contaminans]|nr:cohesin domain-containing protein [Paenibacillus contaminans]